MCQMYILCYNVSGMSDVHPHFHPVASRNVSLFNAWSKKQLTPPAFSCFPTSRYELEGKYRPSMLLPKGRSIAH